MNKWLLIVLIYLTQFSCTGGTKTKPISRKDLIQLLVDINIADAIVSSPQYASQIATIDSASFYGSIYLKHKHTKEELEKTLKYYSAQPDILSAIYDEVFAELNKRSEAIKTENQKLTSRFRKPVWSETKIIQVEGNNSSYPAPIDIPIDSVGNYLITANLKLSKKDQSINPRITAYFYDSLNNVKNRVFFKDFMMSKSDLIRQYQLSMDLKDKSLNRLHVQIPACDSAGAGFYKSLQLTFIAVSRLNFTNRK
jgi:hypothetical protein